MSKFQEKTKQFWRETRGNVAVELLKYLGGSSVLSAIWKAISQAVHHSPVDWLLFGCLVAFGLVLMVIAVSHGKKPSLNQDAPEKIDEPKEQLVLFSPLQIEAFTLARDLRLFLREISSSSDKAPFMDRLQNGYALKFAARVKETRLRLGEAGVEAPFRISESWFEWVTSETDIQQCSKALDQMAIEVGWAGIPIYSRKQIDAMTAEELERRGKTEPGFAQLVARYAETKGNT